jgi:hypothetical protein
VEDASHYSHGRETRCSPARARSPEDSTCNRTRRLSDVLRSTLNPPRSAPHARQTSSHSFASQARPSSSFPLAPPAFSPPLPFQLIPLLHSHLRPLPSCLALSWPATCTPEPPTHNCSCSSSCVWVVQKPRQRRWQARTGQDTQNPSLDPSRPTRGATTGGTRSPSHTDRSSSRPLKVLHSSATAARMAASTSDRAGAFEHRRRVTNHYTAQSQRWHGPSPARCRPVTPPGCDTSGHCGWHASDCGHGPPVVPQRRQRRALDRAAR